MARLPIDFKIRVLELTRRDGKKAREAMETAIQEFRLDLPVSYVKYAGSHVWRFVREVGRQARKNEEVSKKCEEAGLIFEYEESTETTSSDTVSEDE